MITPGTGLKDRQTVRVTAAGFTPGEALAVVECAGKGTGTGPGDCNLAALTPATADTTGAVSVRLQVVVGPFGANHVSCGKPHSCLVSVTQATLAPTEEADAPIKFGA